MPRHGTLEGSAIWSAAQLTAELLGSRAEDYTRVRYRDFVRRPRTEARRALSMVESFVPSSPLEHVRPGRVRLDPQHVVAANPMKTRTGWIELREDREWAEKMAALRRVAVTGLTLPLLARYRGRPAPGRAPLRERQVAGGAEPVAVPEAG